MEPLRRAVVLGCAGFVGSHLCEHLIARGWAVLGVDNLLTGVRQNLSLFHDRNEWEFLCCDVTEGIDVDGDVDTVFHLASPASPKDYLAYPIQTLLAGSLGTQSALDFARAKHARMVLASTSEVYGDPLVHPQCEEYWGNVNPIGPRSVYDEAKRFAEALTMAYHRTYNVDVGIVRLFNTFGPRMRVHDGRAVPTFICQALAQEPITVTGSGQQTRSLCFVDDTVNGLIAMAEARGVTGPINVGGSEEISMLDLARWVRDLVGSTSRIEHVAEVADDPVVRRPALDRAHNQLGWASTVDIRDGLLRTIAHMRSIDTTLLGSTDDGRLPAT